MIKKTHQQKLGYYPRNIDLDSFNDINRKITQGWELELVKYDERNDQLIFQYKRKIKEQ